jgi:hypothetical protein
MKSVKKKNLSQRKRSSANTRKAGLLVLLAIGIMAAIGVGSFLLRTQSGLPPMKAVRTVPPYYETAERAKPFPKTLFPARFSQPSVARAYSVAKAIPDVLVQQPCFCGCASFRHRGLLACFVSEHASRSRVCLKEAFLADRLHKNGHTVASIRRSIISGEWWNERLE